MDGESTREPSLQPYRLQYAFRYEATFEAKMLAAHCSLFAALNSQKEGDATYREFARFLIIPYMSHVNGVLWS